MNIPIPNIRSPIVPAFQPRIKYQQFSSTNALKKAATKVAALFSLACFFRISRFIGNPQEIDESAPQNNCSYCKHNPSTDTHLLSSFFTACCSPIPFHGLLCNTNERTIAKRTTPQPIRRRPPVGYPP
jgi:hypothetical protein